MKQAPRKEEALNALTTARGMLAVQLRARLEHAEQEIPRIQAVKSVRKRAGTP